jgi:hypothetical protein
MVNLGHFGGNLERSFGGRGYFGYFGGNLGGNLERTVDYCCNWVNLTGLLDIVEDDNVFGYVYDVDL